MFSLLSSVFNGWADKLRRYPEEKSWKGSPEAKLVYDETQKQWDTYQHSIHSLIQVNDRARYCCAAIERMIELAADRGTRTKDIAQDG